MGYYNPDVYYQPELLDLEPLGEIDFSDGCYQFDIRVVWKHKPTGRLLTARDSGCSCPSPFEDYGSIEQLDGFDLSSLESELASARNGSYYTHGQAVYTQWLRSLRRWAKSQG